MELKKRINSFDNIKGLLMILVVFGHMINIVYKIHTPIEEVPIIKSIWNVIYTFHMPLFILISGYFSKNYEKSNKMLLETLVFPYCIFNTLNYIMLKVLAVPIMPKGAMWYIFALIIWRMMLPFLSKLKYSVIITTVISLAINFINTDSLEIHVIKYLPVFLIGFHMNSETIGKIKNINKLICIGVLVVSVLLVFVLNYIRIPNIEEMLYIKSTQLEFNKIGVYIFLGRSISLIIGLIISFCIINLMPDKKGILTNIGINSMPVYLLHYLPYVRIVLRKIVFTDNPYIALCEISILTIIIVWVLSRQFIMMIYNKFTGFLATLFKKERNYEY